MSGSGARIRKAIKHQLKRKTWGLADRPPSYRPREFTEPVRYAEQHGLCWICLQALGADITKDHLKPHSRGGKGGVNILLAHAHCNNERQNPPVANIYEARQDALRRIRRHVAMQSTLEVKRTPDSNGAFNP